MADGYAVNAFFSALRELDLVAVLNACVMVAGFFSTLLLALELVCRFTRYLVSILGLTVSFLYVARVLKALR